MANTLTNTARKRFLEGKINWATATLKCTLANNQLAKLDANSVNMATAETLGAIVQPTVRLSNAAATEDGAATADNVTFAKVAPPGSGQNAVGTYNMVVIYEETGAADAWAQCIPIALIDSATGLPITANGGDITVTWDTGANKIFKL